MSNKLVLAAFLCAVLVGCASQQELAARHAYEQEQQRQREIAYTEGLRGQCRAVGYQENSEQFRNCIMQLHLTNQQERAQMMGIILQRALPQREFPLCSSFDRWTASYRAGAGTCR